MQNTGIVLLSQLVLRTLCHSSTGMETGRGQRWTNRVIQDGVGAQHDTGHGPAIPAASAPRSSSARRPLPLGREPTALCDSPGTGPGTADGELLLQRVPWGQRSCSAVYVILLMHLGFACRTFAPGRFVFCIQPMQGLGVRLKNPCEVEDRDERTPAINGGAAS